MVGLFKALLPSLFLATFVVAQGFKITAPSSAIWWVANSQNELDWDCNSAAAQADQKQSGGTFTVLINHPDFAAALAIIAQEPNADCKKSITIDQANQKPGQNYTVLLADPRNNTNVFATSEPFEIKPLGSQYPSQVSSSASAASGTATASSSASATPSSAALSSHSPSFFGLTGIMGLLTVGLLGA